MCFANASEFGQKQMQKNFFDFCIQDLPPREYSPDQANKRKNWRLISTQKMERINESHA